MPRIVSTDFLAAAGGGVTRPAYFLEIQWQDFSTQLCTYGTVPWNGTYWLGGGLAVSRFDNDGVPQQVVIADPDYSFRTKILGSGIRDRRINIWKADIGALGVGDPVILFTGFADKAEIASGRVTISLERNTSSKQFTPRERIGPGIGVNFIAPPNFVLLWGTTRITMTEQK